MPSLNFSQSVLCIIDIQDKLVPAIEPTHLARLLHATQLLLEACHRLQVPVLVTEQYPKGLGHTFEPIRAIVEARQIPVYEKTSFSALGVPSVTQWLVDQARRSIVVVGVESHICVYQTVRDLVAQGFDVYVPYDAVASRRADDHAIALELMRSCNAIITTSESIVFDWLGKAEGDAFKALSKFIREKVV